MSLMPVIYITHKQGAVHFKFGVLYAKAGQRSDDEMFSNRTSQKGSI